ncbi:MAG: replication-associated recombination protein A [Christensenellaceae bacterium]|jgi:putative ATPase
MDLFTNRQKEAAPLADRMRPRTLDEFYGQEQIVGEGKLLRRAILADKLSSSIFWGPPGSGKSTLAEIIANTTKAAFRKVNAVSTGVKEVREIIAQAEKEQQMYGTSTYLLLDECHRWSKAQSDSILPAIEKGTIKFIGSTTENPLVSMTPAIVSRCRLFQFEALRPEDVEQAVRHALEDAERGFGNMDIEVEEEALFHIVNVANGDARAALNAIELAVLTTAPNEAGRIFIDLATAEESIQKRAIRCDEEEYYNMLSAFCKSLRGSDSDGALFWCFRMLYAGIDPRIIVRRMIAHASEDVGLANPAALLQAVAAMQALEFNGMPEAQLNIAQAIIFICESPKSNSVVSAIGAAAYDAEHSYQVGVPIHLRDTSYRGAKELGNGTGYKYAHDYPGHYIPQQYLPDALVGKEYYVPSQQGNEAKIKEAKERRKKKFEETE